MRILLPFIFVLLSASCSTPRVIADSQKDSVVFRDRVVYKDTTLYVPVPQESDRLLLSTSDTSRLQTSLAESEAFVLDGKLHHTLRNRSEMLQTINLSTPFRLQQTEHYLQKEKTVTVEVERELTAWQKLFMALGQGAFVAGLAVLLYIAVRILRKVI